MNKDQAQNVKVWFDGPGNYFLVEGPVANRGIIPLGHCDCEMEIVKAIREVIDAGNGTEDWSGWAAASR